MHFWQNSKLTALIKLFILNLIRFSEKELKVVPTT